MPSAEQPDQKSWLHDDNSHILLATLTAIALAAGSTVLWRARRSTAAAEHIDVLSSSDLHTSPGEKVPEGEEMNTQSEPHTNTAEASGSTKASKSSRSKERRRRGKDHVKEMTKAGTTNTKKSKKQGTASKTAGDAVPKSTMVVPEIIEPGPASRESLDGSTASSSTSRSSSISMTKDPALLDPDAEEPDVDLEGDISLFTTTITSSVSAPGAQERLHEEQTQNTTLLRSSQSESIHLTDHNAILASDSISSFPSSSSNSLTSPSSSTSFSSDKLRDPSSLQPSHSMYPHYTSPSPSSSLSPNGDTSWDYDPQGQAIGAISNGSSSTTYRKPPRFRSRSRGSRAASPIPTSISYVPPCNVTFPTTADNPLLVPSESAPASTSEILPTFTFPTLNPSPSSSPSPGPSNLTPSSTGPKINTSITHPVQRASTPSAHSHSNPHSTNSTPLRTPTPSQSPMASSSASASTPSSVSVSAQTQLASLRGALEAARMREEKAKGEVERLNRECQELRWRWGEDVGIWRRREGELQTHIQVLIQHLQGYASILASLPQTAHLQVAYPNLILHPNGIQHHSYTTPYDGSSTHSPSPASQSQSPHSHPTSPQQNSTSPVSPFSPYSSLQLPQSQHPNNSQTKHTKGQTVTPNSQAHQNLFSLFFPGPGPGGSAVASGSRSGLSSGSASPVQDGSPVGDRGRRPTMMRKRTKTATQRDQDGLLLMDSTAGDGDGEEDGDDGEDEEEEQEEFSNLLADAILKRPESIRDGSLRAMRKDSRGKAANGNGNPPESFQKGEIHLNGDGGGEPEEDEDGQGDGWIREPFSNTSRPNVSGTEDEKP